MPQKLTKHAEIRCSQRGIKNAIVQLVLNYSDFEMPTYAWCRRLQIFTSDSREHAVGRNFSL